MLATLFVTSLIGLFGVAVWSQYCRRELFKYMQLTHSELWRRIGEPKQSADPLLVRVLPVTWYVLRREYRGSSDPLLQSLGHRAFVALLASTGGLLAFVVLACVHFALDSHAGGA